MSKSNKRSGYVLYAGKTCGPSGESNPWGYLASPAADGRCAMWTEWRDRAYVFSSGRAAKAASAAWAPGLVTIEKTAALIVNRKLRTKLPAGTPYMQGSRIMVSK